MQAIAERHADAATVVRLACFKRGGEPSVEEWLAEQEAPPAFVLARDVGETQERRWLDATGHRDRHVTFVVDGRGDLAWVGYESDAFDDAVDQIVAGKFDSRRFGKELRTRYDADRLAEPLIWKLANSAGQRNWNRVVELSDELMGLHETYRGHAVTKYHALIMAGETSKASVWTRTMIKKHIWDDPDALGRLAWLLADKDSELGDKQRDLDLALKVAERADELTQHERAWVIQSLAQTHYARGDALRASELQEQAWTLEKNETAKQDALTRLKRFRRAAGLPEEPPPTPATPATPTTPPALPALPAAAGGDGTDGANGGDGADGTDGTDGADGADG
jgi:hypothetical protein